MNTENTNQTAEGMRVIPAGERKCIWMESGIVSYKLCNNQFQCYTCEFDHAMSIKAKKVKETPIEEKITSTNKREVVEWMEEFKNLPAGQRKCRYMLMGEVSHKICPNSFRCGECSFDQMMQDRIQPIVVRKTEEMPLVSGYRMPENLYYFRNHTWLQLDRMGRITIGIDDFARRLIGKINSIDLPAIGKDMDMEESMWTIHHDFSELNFVSPIQGVVDSVNQKLIENPQLVVEDPYAEGWLLIVNPKSVRKGLKNLLKDEEAKAWIKEDASLLAQNVNEKAGITLQDGAAVSMDISANIPKDEWIELVKQFLYAK